jgi:hypothetical protein
LSLSDYLRLYFCIAVGGYSDFNFFWLTFEAQRLRGSEAQRLRGSEAQRLRGSF